jgi:hypothetical protein
MPKSKINITMDQDLIEFAKAYAEDQRTTVSEIFTQFILNIRRIQREDPTEIILADPNFSESLLETIAQIRAGKNKWHKYEEVF